MSIVYIFQYFEHVSSVERISEPFISFNQCPCLPHVLTPVEQYNLTSLTSSKFLNDS